MNTRKPIQRSTDTAVLGLAFSVSRGRFITSLSDGVRVYRTDNCLKTSHCGYSKDTYFNPGIAVSAALDDRFLAYVPRKTRDVGGSIVIFHDCLVGRELCRFDLYEPILGLRLNQRWMVAVLQNRAVVFSHRQFTPKQQPTPPPDEESEGSTDTLSSGTCKGPNRVHGLQPTSNNPYALASLSGDLLALPAPSVGQAQLIPLDGRGKRVLKAHNTSLRQLSLSPDSSLLATASEQGTLIRIYNTATTDQVAEFRRGVDRAIIFSIAFSPANRWLACTSDKGTLHVFDLALLSSSPPQSHKQQQQQQHRKSHSAQAMARPSSHALTEKESVSAFSGHSSPAPTSAATNTTPTATAASAALPAAAAAAAYHGSVQEYYGLRPPPGSASPTSRETAIGAMAAFKASGLAPKVLKDARSVASAPFWMGEEGRWWQSGGSGTDGITAEYRWTTAPDGTRMRVRNTVVPLANEPGGRPMKGVVGFAPAGDSPADADADGAVLYVIGGGAEGRWEMFELVPALGQAQGQGAMGWTLIMRGFRRFLSRQFVE